MKKIFCCCLVPFMIAILILTGKAGAFETNKLLADDGAQYDYFGWSVAISGDTAIVGAESDDDDGTSSGSAYIFYQDHGGTDNWGQVKKLTASDAAAGDHFGRSIAISGDIVIVGAHRNDINGTNSGSAYIFSRDHGGADNWGQVKIITADDGAADDAFGLSVSINGNIAIVGAYSDDDNGTGSGSAYIFSRDYGGPDNWGQVKKIIANDGAEDDHFGSGVSISGATAIVGAYHDEGASYSIPGSAYIFYQAQGGSNNWGQVQKLTASDGATFDEFGLRVSISGDTAIVGAHLDNDAVNGNDSGSAYIFSRDHGGPDNWGEVTKLTASDGAVGDCFGDSVSLSEDTVIVGASQHYTDGYSPGYAYIFSRDQGGVDNWGEVEKLTASDTASGDEFGYSVSISGNSAIVGAHLDNDAVNGNDSGSAYIFLIGKDDPSLADVIIGLRVLTGNWTGDLVIDDIDGDSRIGLAEVLRDLRLLAY